MDSILKDSFKGQMKTLMGLLFLTYGFLQTSLMWKLSSNFFSSLSSHEVTKIPDFFFYATLLFFIPAEILLDRYSIRFVMISSIFLTLIGNIICFLFPSLGYFEIGYLISDISLALSLFLNWLL